MSTLRIRVVAASIAASLGAAGCGTLQQLSSPTIATGALAVLAQKADLMGVQTGAAAVLAYALYDPFAPNWELEVQQLDEHRVRLEMRLKALHTGGEGEALQIMRRNARRLVREGGFAGYDVLSFEEGVESTRPFAQRVASAELLLLRSRTWSQL
jgi:hypothetical protein